MPAITRVEFREFSARHRNASRNWLVVKLNTDDPAVYGLGDASPMENEAEVKLLRELRPPMLLGSLTGRLTLDAALARLSRLAGARAGVVVLPVAEAAVDVDKPEDLVLVEAILRGRA